MKIRAIHYLKSLTLTALILTCGVRNDPREIADAFCYRYLIELNQAGALEISNGLAADNCAKKSNHSKAARALSKTVNGSFTA